MATWTYNDGGRKSARFKGEAADCVCRAVAIAMQRPYREVYHELNDFAKDERLSRREEIKDLFIKGSVRSSSRTGIRKPTTRQYLAWLGWTYVPCMAIGQRCKVHLRADELPSGRIIAQVSRHVVAVIDGVVHDTHDSTRDGTRCVYGYYYRKV